MGWGWVGLAIAKRESPPSPMVIESGGERNPHSFSTYFPPSKCSWAFVDLAPSFGLGSFLPFSHPRLQSSNRCCSPPICYFWAILMPFKMSKSSLRISSKATCIEPSLSPSSELPQPSVQGSLPLVLSWWCRLGWFLLLTPYGLLEGECSLLRVDEVVKCQ